MKTCIQVLLVLLAFAFFSNTASADGLPPSEEMVCDILQGGTPGLFGLCNAYCEAKDCDGFPEDDQPRSCERILGNYRDKMEAGDPDMPCLDQGPPPPPPFECPCWSLDNLATVSMLVDDGLLLGTSCATSDPDFGGSDTVQYLAGGFFTFNVTASFGFNFCTSVGGTLPFAELMDEETLQGCRDQVLALQAMHFIPNGFTCN